MNIALFGGPFDPVHTGHLTAAKAAARRFHLDRILFVPSGNPPHKVGNHLTSFEHRFAMVTLACAGDSRFVPSLLEVPTPDGGRHYSIATIRKVRHSLARRDRLYFLIGVDAFLDLPQWKDYRQILDLVDFIVVSRPGYPLRKIMLAIPREMMVQSAARLGDQTLHLRKTSIHVVHGMNSDIASSDIRDAVRAGRRVTGLVPPLVEEYIRKEGLYRLAQKRGRSRK